MGVMAEKSVPVALKRWFVVHFVVDTMVAVPLFLFPRTFLTLLGWQVIDPFSARIVAAALFGIGIESFLGRNAPLETYRNMLNLKIIWSGATVLGVALSVYQSTYTTTVIEWLLLLTFLGFHFLWIRFRIRIH
jgi:hypothetical protein